MEKCKDELRIEKIYLIDENELISEHKMFKYHDNLVIKQLRVKHIFGFIPWYYTVDVLFKDLGK